MSPSNEAVKFFDATGDLLTTKIQFDQLGGIELNPFKGDDVIRYQVRDVMSAYIGSCIAANICTKEILKMPIFTGFSFLCSIHDLVKEQLGFTFDVHYPASVRGINNLIAVMGVDQNILIGTLLNTDLPKLVLPPED